jgi:protein SCO1
MISRARFYLFFVVAVVLTSCSRPPAAHRYQLQGRIVAVDPAAHELTVAHQDIPGLMEGMTMPFPVSSKDYWVFKDIAPGDQLHATLVLSDHAELQDITFTKVSATGDGASALHIPQPGDQVPEFTLINQNGKTIHAHEFRGKPLLLTFIYTRCPFPDYCPRLSSNFRQVLRQLQKDPKAFAEAQLLSISIDPEHDKPAALRSYGESYASRVDPKFQHWEFASGSPEQVRQAADFFGLAYDRKDGQIVHGMQTVLVGKEGRVVKVYSGSNWNPEQVAADFLAAAAGRPHHPADE